MQRREDEVTCQRGLDADAGRFRVAHFTHHDDVRVGAQEGLHHGREIEAGLLVDLHLPQPFCVISTGSSAVQILVSGLLR